MIDENNLIDVLKALNFERKSENVYKKFFSKIDCSIEVDIENRNIIYPEEIQIMMHTTTNFDSPENFVVLECVTRLLDKGYRPEHIELEKRWRVGHNATGGRSDICVSDTDDKMLFIIECKTAGAEYTKEHKQMELDGGQLFSYWHQDRDCQWLVLYTSDFVDGKLKYTADSVDCHDDKNKRKNIYKDAKNVKELFEVWSKTYEKKFCGDVIFNDDTVAYKIGQKPLTKSRLVEFDRENKIVNDFEEILRHNNISDKENAFNRLMALFICKLTDESQKSDDDELDFQYRSGTDDFESFQDRLQRLYHEGMKKFMNEEIFYIANDYVYKTLSQYTNEHKRRMLTDELNKTMRHLKFYTNNDFAFKEIHNKKLFEQNAEILKEVVKKFQNYKIIGAKNLQFLGDLFEQLLNKGFKQNEGQFFTPIPITRFIWDSLPLKKVITSAKKLPKIIDYACGAGHFLTQGFEAVNDFVSKKFSTDLDSNWVNDKLFGIEKDYRLARVSKISLFMYGAGAGNIIFGDGLENYSERNIKNNTFDILVANPPYSVSAFKNHLHLSNADDFEVLSKISSEGSEIETLFVERIAQLLKPNGLAAVILPSSILNKENTSFIAARESILRNFNIRAIVQLGSKTFGATGTNTVVMFLEKFDEPPKRFNIVVDSLDAIFELRNLSDWEDEFIFRDWLLKINVDEETYKKFLSHQANFDEWADNEYFKKYYEAFVNSNVYLKKKNQPSFKKMTVEEQMKWCNLKFYEFAYEIEREKIRYFACVYKQTTLIVTAPTDNKSQEKFLGYTWSNRKGQEGMQYINEGGLLYDKNDHEAENTIAALVRSIFSEQKISVESLQDYYYYLRLQDMIDFTNINFNKVIKTTKIRELNLNDGTLYKLSDESIFDVSIGNRVLSSEVVDNGQYPVYSANVFEPFGRIDKLNRDDFSQPSIIWGIDGDWQVNLIEANQPFYPTDHCGVIRIKTDDILPKYLMIALRIIGEHEKFSRSNRASTNRIKNLSVDIPSLDIQKQIVSEFNKIENAMQVVEKFLIASDEHIKNKFDKIFANVNDKKLLGDLAEIIQGTSPKSDFYNENGTGLPFYQGKKEFGEIYLQTPTIWTNSAIKISIKYDILMSVRAPVGDVNINPFDKICIGRGLAAIRCNEISRFYIFYYLLFNKIDGHSGVTFESISGNEIKSIEIPLPSIEEQKKFAEYVQSIEKQKNEAISRKELLIAQRDELISKYFR